MMIEPILAFGGLTTLYIIDKNNRKKDIVDKKDNYKEKRNPDGFTKSVQNAIQTITFSDNTLPVGSYSYRIHSYPSDIDIFEVVKRCCTIQNVTKEISQKFKTIAKNIYKNKELFLGDFKAGLDYKLLFDYGEILYKKPLQIKGYKYEEVNNKLDSFKKDKWISKKEYDILKKLAIPNIDIKTFMKLQELLRNLYLVRWSLDELIRGEKTLRSGDILKMEDAITHDSIVKIDIWSPINNNYTEVTNVYYLILEDKDSKKTVLNKELGNYIINLDKDIQKYSSTIFRNSLKVAKRLWIKNNLIKNVNLIKKLNPLFYSGISSLNQIKEEAKVILSMLNRNKDTSSCLYKEFKTVRKVILKQLDGFKQRINDIHDVSFSRNEIFDKLDKCINAKSLNIVEKNIVELIDLLNPIIERKSLQYLSKNNIIKLIPRKSGIDINDNNLGEYEILY